jgi:hypothetical protein
MPGGADPLDGHAALPCQLDQLGTAVIRIRDAGDVVGALQLLNLPRHVRRLHGKQIRELAGPDRLGHREVPQQGSRGAVEIDPGEPHQPFVLARPTGQVGDLRQVRLDLDDLRRDHGGLGRCGGHMPSSQLLAQVKHGRLPGSPQARLTLPACLLDSSMLHMFA